MIIHGKVTERTGSTFVIFGYNGRDGVVTGRNGLIYMRARYYSPEHRRFVNADVIPGEISNAITLNRYAYANGNPVSNVDPFGLSAEREQYINSFMETTDNFLYKLLQSAGIKLTEEYLNGEAIEEISVLLGGIKIKLIPEVTFDKPIDLEYTEVTTPELELPWGNGDEGIKFGTYVDPDRLSGGVSGYYRFGEWTISGKHQMGVYSEANIISLTYNPEDEKLPTVSLSLDIEINHLVKASAAAVALAIVFAPEVIAVVAPTIGTFVEQLISGSGTLAPATT